MRRELLFAAVAAGAIGVPASAQNLLTNGGFETGDLTGWSASTIGPGDISVMDLSFGAALPLSTRPANGAAGGAWYATTDQDDSSSYELYQFFTVPENHGKVIVSYDLAVTSYAEFEADTQQVKIELFEISLERGGLPATLYLGAPLEQTQGQPNPYQHYAHDITADVTPGSTYVFYFSQIATDGDLVAALDNAVVTPAPGAAAVAALGGPWLARRRRR